MDFKKLILCASATLVLASCGGGSATSSTATTTTNIIVWCSGPEEAVVKSLVDEYNKTASFKVAVTTKAISEADAGTSLGTDPEQKDYPALAAIADDQLAALVKNNVVAKLPDSHVTTIKSADVATAVTAATVGSNMYGYPVQADNGYFLYYDSSFISDEEAKTLEGVMRKCDSSHQFGFDIANGWYVNSIFHAQGVAGTESIAWKYNDENKPIYDISWDTAKCVTACEYITSLFKTATDNKSMIPMTNEAIEKGFADESMIAAVCGTWEAETVKASCPTVKFTKLPTFTDSNGAHQMGSFTGTKMYVVNSHATADEQKAAFIVGNLLTDKAGQLARFTARGALPCNKEALADEAYTKNVSDYAKALNEQNQYAAIQSASVEGRYWTPAANIGTAMKTGVVDGGWASYLKDFCDLLRAPAA